MKNSLTRHLVAPLLVTFLAIAFFPGCPGDAENRPTDLPIPVPGPDDNPAGNSAAEKPQGTTLRFVGDPVSAKIERSAPADTQKTKPGVASDSVDQALAADQSADRHHGDGHGPYSAKEKVDFEKRNGPIFVGWQRNLDMKKPALWRASGIKVTNPL